MPLRDELIDLCFSSPRWDDGYSERMNQEMSHIEAGEYEPYYMALHRKGIQVDTSRHLVAYLMEIADTFDPNTEPEQTGDMPDIDIDFSDRKIVMQYLKERYGEDYVSYINNYTKLKGKSAVRDVARVLEVSLPGRLEEIMTEGGDDWSVSTFWKEMDEETYSLFDEQVIEVLRKAVGLEGNLRQMGVTAAGAIISNVPVEEYTALYINSDKEIVSVFDKKDVESIGFIKFDVLLVKNIAVIQETIKLVQERGGVLPDNIWDIPYDKKMMQEFHKGNTALIFQYQGKALRGYLSDLKPESLQDLVAANALCRPGADGEGYARRKNGIERVSYLHDALKPILNETYGVITYQEDIMRICRNVAGMMHKDVERVRKMIGKKDISEADELKEIFVRGCLRFGLDRKSIEDIWLEIMKAGSYAFNKSHAVAYFLIGWTNMYLQVNHPLEWVLGNLIITDDDTKKITIFSEAKRLGVDIGYVDVNRSRKNWSYQENTLIPGLAAVPGVGPKAAEGVAKHAPYESLEDMQEKLPKRVLNKTVEHSLSRAGAIPGVEGEKIFRALASGHPVDITEGREIHPSWDARPISQLGSSPMVVHGYLMSTSKKQRDYQLNIIGDEAIKLYHSQKLEAGAYLFLVDNYDFAHVYYACPLDKAHRHPIMSRDSLPMKPLKSKGPGFAFLGSTKKTKKGKFVSLVLTPKPMTLWLDNQYEKGFYIFEKKGWDYTGISLEDWNERKEKYSVS